MKTSLIILVVIFLALAIPPGLSAQGGMPKMTSVEPPAGKAGDELTVNGENLGKSFVAELYFTDGKNDVKIPMLSQEAAAIKFKVPATVKPGRFTLMILTAGKDPKLIEQPVKVTIE